MDTKISNIKKKILYYANYKGLKYDKFSESLNMSYGSFKGIAKNRPINSDALEILITKHPNLNPEWLLTGKGEMLRSVEAQGRASQVLQEPREANPLVCAACEEKERIIASKEKQIEVLECQNEDLKTNLERVIASKDEMLELYKDRIEELKCNPAREVIKKSS